MTLLCLVDSGGGTSPVSDAGSTLHPGPPKLDAASTVFDFGFEENLTDKMDSSALVSKVHPGLSIAELIKFIRYTFRQCEFDEVQNALMEREKRMKLEIEELVRDNHSLKKELETRLREIDELRREKLDATRKPMALRKAKGNAKGSRAAGNAGGSKGKAVVISEMAPRKAKGNAKGSKATRNAKKPRL